MEGDIDLKTLIIVVTVTVGFIYTMYRFIVLIEKTKKARHNQEEEEMKAEMERCKSPHYFMTHYWKVNGKLFQTRYSQDEFDNMIKDFYK